MDEIAEAAGVSKRTIYNLYEGKEKLFRAALDDAFSTAEAYAAEVIEPLDAENLEEEMKRAAAELARIVTSPQIMRLSLSSRTQSWSPSTSPTSSSVRRSIDRCSTPTVSPTRPRSKPPPRPASMRSSRRIGRIAPSQEVVRPSSRRT